MEITDSEKTLTNHEKLDYIRNTIECELDDYYSDIFQRIFDILVDKGFLNKKSNIIEIKAADTYNSDYIENGYYPSSLGFFKPPTDNYTFIFSIWATLMYGTFKLYNMFQNDSDPIIEINDDTQLNILILNGGSRKCLKRNNDFKASYLQKFIPHINEDCVIIIEKDYNDMTHAQELLLEHGYKNIENIFYYENN